MTYFHIKKICGIPKMKSKIILTLNFLIKDNKFLFLFYVFMNKLNVFLHMKLNSKKLKLDSFKFNYIKAFYKLPSRNCYVNWFKNKKSFLSLKIKSLIYFYWEWLYIKKKQELNQNLHQYQRTYTDVKTFFLFQWIHSINLLRSKLRKIQKDSFLFLPEE